MNIHPSCTCTIEMERYELGSFPVLTEPNPYCRVDFPKNHARREQKARTGYEQRTAAMIAVNPWTADIEAPWDRLPEPGKAIWRTWAEAEFWGSGYDDGAAGETIEIVEAPPEPSDFGRIASF